MLVIIAALPQPSGTSVAIFIFLNNCSFHYPSENRAKKGVLKKAGTPSPPAPGSNISHMLMNIRWCSSQSSTCSANHTALTKAHIWSISLSKETFVFAIWNGHHCVADYILSTKFYSVFGATSIQYTIISNILILAFPCFSSVNDWFRIILS